MLTLLLEETRHHHDEYGTIYTGDVLGTVSQFVIVENQMYLLIDGDIEEVEQPLNYRF